MRPVSDKRGGVPTAASPEWIDPHAVKPRQAPALAAQEPDRVVRSERVTEPFTPGFAAPARRFADHSDPNHWLDKAVPILWRVETAAVWLNAAVEEIAPDNPEALELWKNNLDYFSRTVSHLLTLEHAHASPSAPSDYRGLLS